MCRKKISRFRMVHPDCSRLVFLNAGLNAVQLICIVQLFVKSWTRSWTSSLGLGLGLQVSVSVLKLVSLESKPDVADQDRRVITTSRCQLSKTSSCHQPAERCGVYEFFFHPLLVSESSSFSHLSTLSAHHKANNTADNYYNIHYDNL